MSRLNRRETEIQSTAQASSLDADAIAEFIATLDPGYVRHKRLGSDLQAQLDAIFLDATSFVDYDRIDRALDLGANINLIHPGFGATALHIAVGRQNKELIEHLLRRGGRLDVEDKEHITALDDAWRRARLEIDTPFAVWLEESWRNVDPMAKGKLSLRLGL